MSTGYDSLRRLLQLDPRAVSLAFFLCGAVLTLAFAPLSCFALAPLLLLPLLAATLHCEPRRAARHGFWFGAGLFLFGTYWLYTSIHVFGKAPLWVAIPLMLGLVLIMAGWYALTGWAVARLAAGSPWRLLAVAPAAWLLVEWFRGWFLTGFPWLSLGYSQVDSPLAGLLPVTGVYGATFAVVWSAAALILSLARDGAGRRAGLALAVTPWIAAGLLQSVDWTAPASGPRTATIVQGGVSQDQKWRPEQFEKTLRLYADSLYRHPDSDLVVWPEVAIPALTTEVGSYLEALAQRAADTGQSLVLGILERTEGNIYNSVLLLDGTPRQVYRKRHLVPFGEFFPVPDAVREWLRLMSLPHSDMTPGASVQPLLETSKGDRLSVAICYEDAYGAEQLYAFPEATLLINVSNDAWFGDSIAPHQHLEIARARALEAGRYTIRATNNGISAFIGPDGQVLETAPQFEYATLTREVVPMSGRTLYAVVGNWPVVAMSALLLAVAAWRRP